MHVRSSSQGSVYHSVKVASVDDRTVAPSRYLKKDLQHSVRRSRVSLPIGQICGRDYYWDVVGICLQKRKITLCSWMFSLYRQRVFDTLGARPSDVSIVRHFDVMICHRTTFSFRTRRSKEIHVRSLEASLRLMRMKVTVKWACRGMCDDGNASHSIFRYCGYALNLLRFCEHIDFEAPYQDGTRVWNCLSYEERPIESCVLLCGYRQRSWSDVRNTEL